MAPDQHSRPFIDQLAADAETPGRNWRERKTCQASFVRGASTTLNGRPNQSLEPTSHLPGDSLIPSALNLALPNGSCVRARGSSLTFGDAFTRPIGHCAFRSRSRLLARVGAGRLFAAQEQHGFKPVEA